MFPSPFGVLFFFISNWIQIFYFFQKFPSPFGVLFFFIKSYVTKVNVLEECFRLLSEFYSFLWGVDDRVSDNAVVSVSFRSSILFYFPVLLISPETITLFPSPFGVLFFFIYTSIIIQKTYINSFRLLSEFYSFLFESANWFCSFTFSFRLLSEFYSFLLFNFENQNYVIDKRVSVSFRSSILFYLLELMFLIKLMKVSVSFRSSILFYLYYLQLLHLPLLCFRLLSEFYSFLL